ncbi:MULTISPECIES: lipase family protein [Nocardia]|uniref:lipase family protein n=1 Tax=Nocardia TaxID=1817 RepID=UPI0013008FC7|nr:MULTISPECIES: lipase family protein [Nocardia]
MDDTATDDEFYRAPDVDAYSLPGKLLRRRSVPTPSLPGAHRAWQLVYATRTSRKAPIPASGIVITAGPTSTTDKAPILLYCPVFRGLGGAAAASQLLTRDESEPETEFISSALERGWTVAVPDGQGMGLTELGPHAFLAGRAAAHAVLDLARATLRLPEMLAAEAPCAAWGYADGGRAAVWAAELQPDYAPELDLRGIAAGAVIADPGSLAADVDGGPLAGLTLAGLIGLARAYTHLPVAHLITAEGHRAIEQAQTMTAAEVITTFEQTPLGAWCERPDPWNDPLWRYVLANETTGHGTPHARVHLYHGTQDMLVPVAMGRGLFTEYRTRGVDLSWREYNAGHAQTAIDGAREAVSRLASYLRSPRLTRPPFTDPLTN